VEQQIQYVRTSDGVSIACSAVGSGPTLVYLPDFVVCHLERALELPTSRAHIERFTRAYRTIRFDPRGCGMSDRDVDDLTLDGRLRDLEAVIDRLADGQVILHGAANGATVLMAYAAKHPERVSHLIVTNAWQSLLGRSVIPRAGALRRLLSADWDLYVENQARVAFGWDDPMSREIADLVRHAVDWELVQRFYTRENLATADVTELLPSIQAPTVIVHHTQGSSSLEAARALASGIPGARLHSIEGTDSNLAPVADLVYRFTGVLRGVVAADEPNLRTILFTDVEGHSAIMHRLGDEAGRTVLREAEMLTRQALGAYGGAEVKAMGDGFMASFESARRALDCAVSLQRAIAARNASADVPLQLRIGISAGEPIAEQNDLFGTVVITAARICDHARGGEILVANVVRELAAGKGFLFADRGPLPLRGIEEPVRAFELHWQEPVPIP
jgi:class 3 adenylate cyclase